MIFLFLPRSMNYVLQRHCASWFYFLEKLIIIITTTSYWKHRNTALFARYATKLRRRRSPDSRRWGRRRSLQQQQEWLTGTDSTRKVTSSSTLSLNAMATLKHATAASASVPPRLQRRQKNAGGPSPVKYTWKGATLGIHITRMKSPAIHTTVRTHVYTN